MSYKRDYSQGKEDAQRDLEGGELIYKTAGMQAPWAGHWNRILQERHGVTVVWGVGCTASEEEIEYVRGYNEIASQAILERYGSNILEDASVEAMKAYAIARSDKSNKPEMESPVDRLGTVVCAYCEGRFNVTEGENWDGHTHKECGYKLRLYKVDTDATI